MSEGAYWGGLEVSDDMQVGRGGLKAFVAQKSLYLPDVHSVHQEVGGKAVPQGVHACGLGYPGAGHSLPHGHLDDPLPHMVPSHLTRAGVNR